MTRHRIPLSPRRHRGNTDLSPVSIGPVDVSKESGFFDTSDGCVDGGDITPLHPIRPIAFAEPAGVAS